MSTDDGHSKTATRRIVFNSNSLPDHLDEDRRRKLWCDLYGELYGTPNVRFRDGRPMQASFVFTSFGSVTIAECGGTVSLVDRTPRDVAAERNDMCYLVINRSEIGLTYEGLDPTLRSGDAILMSSRLPGKARFDPGVARYNLVAIPRTQLQNSISDIDALLHRRIDPQRPAVQLLQRYIDLLNAIASPGAQAPLTAHVETTLTDLLTLVLKNDGDAVQIARTRGLRAARLQQVLTEIAKGFGDPAFSPHAVGARIGVTTRYVQELLTEAGSSFTDRVIELRLQKARAMLADRNNDRLRVTDIALACGFNEVSYFNRCFRRRFGASPTQYRGGNGD